MSPHLQKWGEKSFSKKSFALAQKVLMRKIGCVMGWDNLGVQVNFRENRKFLNLHKV